MKFKKIIVMMLCCMIIICSVPLPGVRAASSSGSQNLLIQPAFASNTGYYYENSSILSAMPDGGNSGQHTFNFLKHISGTPYTYTWEDVKATNVYTYALAEIIDDSNRFDPVKQEQDFISYYDIYYFSYITYYSGYPRDDYDSGGVSFSYRFYIVPKDTSRVALYNNVEGNEIVLCYNKDSWNKIYTFNSTYTHVNRSDSAKGPSNVNYMYQSWIASNTVEPKDSDACRLTFNLRDSYTAGPGQLISSNIPMFGSAEQARKYADDASGLPLNPDQDPFNSIGCDQYYFDSFDLNISEYSGGYQIVVDYDYSCPDMVAHPEDYFFRIDAVQTLMCESPSGSGNVKKVSVKYKDPFSMYLNYALTSPIYLQCESLSPKGSKSLYAFTDILSLIMSAFGGNFSVNETEIYSSNLYVTVTLYHSYLALDNDFVRKHFVQTSSDIRTFSYDCLTGRSIESHSPTVKTKDVTDSEGNVVDRVMESFTWYDENYDIIYDRSYNEHTEFTDNSTGHNSTYTDNSTNTTFETGDNSVVNSGDGNNFNWNWGTGGGGSGGGGSGDSNMNLLDILKWFTMLIEFLWSGDMESFVAGIGNSGAAPFAGIFSVMQVFFSWLPAPIIIILIVAVLIYVACAIFNKFFS